MALHESFSEKDSFNVYWKIKNFSFCCKEIKSPEFSISENRYWLSFSLISNSVICQLHGSTSNKRINLTRRISFLTCDGSPEQSGCTNINLLVPKDAIFGKRRHSFLPEDTLTVRFRCLTPSERGNVFMWSEIGVIRKHFLWRYQDVSKDQHSSVKYVENSERFGYIKLSLKSTGGFNTEEKLFIELSRKGSEMCYCILKVSVLDVDGIAVNEISDEYVFEKQEDVQTKVFSGFYRKSKLLACKNQLLPSDTLTLKCDFAMSLGSLSDQSMTMFCEDFDSLIKESNLLSPSLRDKNDGGTVAELQTDFKSILDDGTLCDGTLQIGKEVIKVHKTILCARSPVFRAMFTKNMKEGIDGTVVIEDLDMDTVRGLLLYIYTDSMQCDRWENMKKLYFAADKYEILGLKKKCVSFLKANLSVSNVCEALLLADLHQDKDLKTSALDLISEYDSAVFTSEEWKEMEKSNSLLAVQVMREFCCSKRIRLH